MLQIRDLVVRAGESTLVDGLSLDLPDGSRLGLVGESGSGKSLTLLAVLGLLAEGLHAEGSILLDGVEILGRPERELAALRGRRIGLVLQDPGTALNPLRRVGRQIMEPLRRHRLADRATAARRAIALAERVGLPNPESIVTRYPHELSGGQRQRVQIAIAIAAEPAVLLADEPTTALDASVQAGILDLLEELRAERGMSTIFVTHDLAVLRRAADDGIVLRAGRVVESAPVSELLSAPRSPAARELLAAARATAWPEPDALGGGQAPLPSAPEASPTKPVSPPASPPGGPTERPTEETR